MISVCFVKSPLLILLPTPLKQMCIQNKTHEAYQKESDGLLPRGRDGRLALASVSLLNFRPGL